MGNILNITVDEATAEALRQEAAATGRSESEIVADALRARMTHRKGKAGLRRFFGIMEGPADLSCSKLHRETWGKGGG